VTVSLSIEHARRLAIHAQGLAAPPEAGTRVADVVSRIGCLQLDPVGVVARSPLLVLRARLQGGTHDSHARALNRAAYVDRDLFDYWCHEASLCHIDDLPLHRWAMRTHIARLSPARTQRARWLADNAGFAEHVEEDLRARGPLRARELEDRSAAAWEWGHWTDEVSSRQTIARLLQMLWLSGWVGVSRRVGMERVWDVFERCVPEHALAGATRFDDHDGAAERDVALRAVRMLGVARPAHVRAHFLRRRYRQLPATLAALTAAGRLQEVRVSGLGDGAWFATPEDLARLGDLAPGTRTTVLSPFDNVLCDRARTTELFGFDHRLEIYVPPAKRRWGYYVLPILHRERLVARADAVLDRDAGLLRVHALHREPDVRRTPAVDRALAGSLQRLAAWRGASGVVVARDVSLSARAS